MTATLPIPTPTPEALLDDILGAAAEARRLAEGNQRLERLLDAVVDALLVERSWREDGQAPIVVDAEGVGSAEVVAAMAGRFDRGENGLAELQSMLRDLANGGGPPEGQTLDLRSVPRDLEPAEEDEEDEPARPATLCLLPVPPSGQVTPDDALEWIEDQLGGYAAAISTVVHECRDKGLRGAATMLLLDVVEMVKTCTAAIDTGEPQPIEREDRYADESQVIAELHGLAAYWSETDDPDSVDEALAFAALEKEAAVREAVWRERGGRR